MTDTANDGWSDPKPLTQDIAVYADYWLWLGDATKQQDQIDPFSLSLADTRPGKTPQCYPPYEADAEPSPHGFLTPDAIPNPDGACVVGLIDDAIPFAHQRLCAGAGQSRVASIWLQGAQGTTDDGDPDKPGLDLPFGRELRGEAISDFLARHTNAGTVDEQALYCEAGAIDQTRARQQNYAAASSHGSAIADLAAGFDTHDPVAKQFPIIAVSLPPKVSRDTLGIFMPQYLLAATKHIIDRTRRLCRWIEHQKGLPPLSVKLPVVINLSYGLTAGAKDGSGSVAAFQDDITQNPPADIGPVRFVISMGNHRLTRSHARLASDQPIDWHVQPDDVTPSFVEIWSDPSADDTPMQLRLTAPDMAGQQTTNFTGFDQWAELTAGPNHIARAYLQRVEQGDGTARQCITLAIPPTVPSHVISRFGRAGIWQLSPISAAPVHAYVQRDESLEGASGSGGRQSYFNAPDYQIYDDSGRLIEMDDGTCAITRYGTLNSFACGKTQIRVGSERADGSLTPYSGLGFEGGAAIEGDRTAPSDRSVMRPGILTMGLLSGSRQLLSGTSVAAPQVTREIAHDMAGIEMAPKPVLAEY